MVDLFSEIRAEARQEQLVVFVKKYWRPIVGIFIVSILMLALGQIWGAYQTSNQEASGHLFNQALRQESPEEVIKQLSAVVDDGTANYRGIAALNKAHLLLREKKREEALTTYRALYEDGGVDVAIRDLGAYLAAFLLYDEGKFDEAKKLSGELVGNGRPWRFKAMELQAYIALEQKNPKHAVEILEAIEKNNEVPPSLKQRASTLLAIAKRAEKSAAGSAAE